jgi:2-keto-myo-inositol isomerase
VAPLDMILRTLKASGGETVLSLELFNREYWKQDPQEVLKTGAAKMRAAVERAG